MHPLRYGTVTAATIPTQPSLNFWSAENAAVPFTMSGWIRKPSALGTAGTVPVLTANSADPFRRPLFSIGFDGKGHLRAWVGATDDETSSLDSQYPLNDGWWHYIAISRHPNAKAMVLYVDGYMVDGLDLEHAPTVPPAGDLFLTLGSLQAYYVDIAVWNFWSTAWEADTEGLHFGPPPEDTPGLLRAFDFTQAKLPEGVTDAAHHWNVPCVELSGNTRLGLILPKDKLAMNFGGGGPQTDDGRWCIMAWLGVLPSVRTSGTIVSTITPNGANSFLLNFSVENGAVTFEVYDQEKDRRIITHTVPAQAGLPSYWMQWTHVALHWDAQPRTSGWGLYRLFLNGEEVEHAPAPQQGLSPYALIGDDKSIPAPYYLQNVSFWEGSLSAQTIQAAAPMLDHTDDPRCQAEFQLINDGTETRTGFDARADTDEIWTQIVPGDEVEWTSLKAEPPPDGPRTVYTAVISDLVGIALEVLFMLAPGFGEKIADRLVKYLLPYEKPLVNAILGYTMGSHLTEPLLSHKRADQSLLFRAFIWAGKLAYGLKSLGHMWDALLQIVSEMSWWDKAFAVAQILGEFSLLISLLDPASAPVAEVILAARMLKIADKVAGMVSSLEQHIEELKNAVGDAATAALAAVHRA